ncbi:hypothetical protein Barb4_03248 [Bacteroidales bacterium Barb4]|nr:hypothetical protein Barb4_03248 [Bacteroidales bacterium Barb4]
MQPVESHHRHQQRQRRIQPARYTDNRRLCLCMRHPLGKPRRLHTEYILPTLLRAAARDKGRRIYGTIQPKRFVRHRPHSKRYVHRLFGKQAKPFREIRIDPSVMPQMLHVQLTDDKLFIRGEPLGLFQYHPVLRNQGTAGKDHVRC